MAEPLLVQAICQVDTVRGWQYLDDAGKVMNKYDDVFATKQVTAEGLRMGDRQSGPISQVQVTPKMIWASFDLPDTPQVVRDHSAKIVATVAQLINVTTCRRMALRMMYLVDVNDRQLAELIRSGTLFSSPVMDAAGISADRVEVVASAKVTDVASDARATVRLQRATRGPEAPPTFPESGLMVDIDLFREVEKPGEIPVAELRRFCADSVDWIGRRVASTVDAVRAVEPNG